MKERINFLREFSIPLIAGVAVALFWAQVWPESYRLFLARELVGTLSVRFLVNDIFMVFFFAIAAVEITQSCMPGGNLNPLRKALNPLLATFGGVVGPAVIYLLLNGIFGRPALASGWGIPTATDIAIAWLAARMVFGARHPAVSYLLLLAIADDAIGLAIIALFYPDPLLPVQPAWLLLTLLGMAVAWGLRRGGVGSYWPYVLAGGGASWAGLHAAHLHPALALVCIVPFLPHPPREHKGLFEEDPRDRSPLSRFEHEWKVVVDFGLFLFGIANAGVPFSSIGVGTWLVFCALFVGKTVGVFGMGMLGTRLGIPLPAGMRPRHLLLVGIIAGVGFTVAIFVATQAFAEELVQNEAKMGALFSILLAMVAVAGGRLLKVTRRGG